MVTQQITAIALRVFAIWLLGQVVLSLPYIALVLESVEKFYQPEILEVSPITVMAAMLVVGLVTALLIYRVSRSILNRAGAESEVTLGEDSQKLLFQLAGSYFIVTALADMPQSLAASCQALHLSDFSVFAGLLFKLLVGLWLLSVPRFWLRIFNRLRGRE